MRPMPTLYDFTHGLLQDPQALSEFQADPEGVLRAAGLGDVTAADVHEVFPLVMDGEALPRALSVADTAVDKATGTLGVDSGVTSAVDGVNTAVDSVAAGLDGGLGNAPVIGSIVTGAAADMVNAFGAVDAHAHHGTLVSTAADAGTNHLLDSALATALNNTLNEDAPPLGAAFSTTTHTLAGPLASVNDALGSTPARGGEHNAHENALSAPLNELHATAAGIADHSAALPAVGNAVPADQAAHLGQTVSTATQALSHVPTALPHDAQLPVGHAAVPEVVTDTLHQDPLHQDTVHQVADEQHTLGADALRIGHEADHHALDLPAVHDFHPGL